MDTALTQTTAAQMVELHGAKASAVVGDRADKALAAGDLAGFRHWMRIKAAVDLSEQNPSASEP